MMNYQIEEKPNHIVIVRLMSSISAYELQKMKDIVHQLRGIKGKEYIIIDLENVDFIDAFALGIIISFSNASSTF